MSITSQWDNQQHSTLLTICRNWTWADLQQHEWKVVRPMLATTEHPVAMVIKTHACATDYTSAMIDFPALVPPEFGHELDVVVFVTNFAENTMPLNMAHQRYSPVSRYYTIAPSIDAARRMIQSHRSSRAVSAYHLRFLSMIFCHLFAKKVAPKTLSSYLKQINIAPCSQAFSRTKTGACHAPLQFDPFFKTDCLVYSSEEKGVFLPTFCRIDGVRILSR